MDVYVTQAKQLDEWQINMQNIHKEAFVAIIKAHCENIGELSVCMTVGVRLCFNKFMEYNKENLWQTECGKKKYFYHILHCNTNILTVNCIFIKLKILRQTYFEKRYSAA